jgi:hypothetical protein
MATTRSITGRLALGIVVVLTLTGLGNTAHAQRNSEQLAIDLLGSKGVCRLTYDQTAIAFLIEKNVPTNDMSFTSDLRLTTIAAQHETVELSVSSKTAHCAQIERVARFYGL